MPDHDGKAHAEFHDRRTREWADQREEARQLAEVQAERYERLKKERDEAIAERDERYETTDPYIQRIDAVLGEVADLRTQRDKFREHSVTLNGIGWRMAEVLGDVPEGADAIHADVGTQLDRLIARVEVLETAARRVVDEWGTPDEDWIRPTFDAAIGVLAVSLTEEPPPKIPERGACGFCSGGPVINSDCPFHGAAAVGGEEQP